MTDTWILYQTTNLLNSKVYVGVHKLANTRYSKRYFGSGTSLLLAVKKYGRDNFIRDTLAEFACAEDAFLAEAALVTEEFCNRKDTYNIKIGGEGGVGRKHTEESRSKLKEANLGKRHTEETKAKIGAAIKGKITSPETKAKISIANTGKIRSKEVIEKLRAANNHKSLAVVVNGKYYETVKFATKAEGLRYHSTVSRRIANTKPKWSEWRYATDEEKAAYASSALE